MYGDDTALLDAWITGRDAEAFKELTRRYSGMVYGTCLRLLRNTADAEELTQECFLKLAESRTAPRQSLGGWLHSVARNNSINRIRADVRREKREVDFADTQEPAIEVTWNDLIPLVDEAIDTLPDDLRDPVVAHFLEDRTHREISESVNLKRETVTYRIKKGVEQIRAKLDRKGVVISSASLVGLLEANGASAASAQLSALLGKLALGGNVIQSGGVAAVGFLGVSKSAVVAIALLLIAAVGGTIYVQNQSQDSQRPISQTAALTEPTTEGVNRATDGVETEIVPANTDSSTEIGSSAIRVQGPAVVGLSVLHGTVKDESGEPVSGVGVRLDVMQDGYETNWWDSRYLKDTVTNEFGEYRFEDVPGSWHRNVPSRKIVRTIGASGFATRRSNHYGTASNRPTKLDLELKPAQSLVGRIETRDGKPIPKASVFPVMTNGRDEGHFEAIAFGVYTDASGRFKFDELSADGVWTLMIRTEDGITGAIPVESLGADRQTFTLPEGGIATGGLVAADSTRSVVGANVLIHRTDILPRRPVLTPWNARVVTTNDEGNYELPALAEGVYEATLLPNHESLYVLDSDVATFDIENGKVTEIPDLYVREGSTASGQVLRDSTGVPLSDLKVKLQLESQPLWLPNEMVTDTDVNGHFSFSGIPNGQHYLRTGAHHQSMVVQSKETINTIEIRSENIAPVSGKVVDTNGQPVAGALVRFKSYDNIDSIMIHTDGNGNFATEPMIPCDDLFIMAFSNTHVGQTPDLLTIGENGLNGVEIVMDRPLTASVSGAVFDTSGNPYYRAQVRLLDSVAGYFNSHTGRVAANGNFEISRLAPGTYGVQVLPANSQMFTGGNFKAHITVSADEAKTGVVINLAGEEAKNLSISGTVVDGQGKAIEEAYIDVHGNHDMVRTRSDGRFIVKNLKAGDYYVYAAKPGFGRSHVEARAGSGMPAKIVLHRLGKASGRIVADDTGRPITAFHILAAHVRAPLTEAPRYVPERSSLSTTENLKESLEGEFELENVEHGKGYVIASAPGYQPVIKAIDFDTSHDVSDVGVIRLVPGGSFTVAVSLEDGTPVEGCKVIGGKFYYNQKDRNQRTAALGTTDGNGEFTIRSVGAAARLVNIHKEGFAPIAVAIPDTALSEDVTTTVVLERGASITGSVEFPKDTGSIYSMSLKRIGFGDEPQLSSPILNGKYTIEDISPGEYVLSVSWSPERDTTERWESTKRISIKQGDELNEDLILRLGDGVVRSTLRGNPDQDGLRWARIRFDGGNGWNLVGKVLENIDGVFEFRWVPAGNGTLNYFLGNSANGLLEDYALDVGEVEKYDVEHEIEEYGSISLSVLPEPGIRSVVMLFRGSKQIQFNSLADIEALREQCLTWASRESEMSKPYGVLLPGTYTVALIHSRSWTDDGLVDAVIEQKIVHVESEKTTLVDF
jgi:RNA polymerase sigma-70 factor (ECF subfamily)